MQGPAIGSKPFHTCESSRHHGRKRAWLHRGFDVFPIKAAQPNGAEPAAISERRVTHDLDRRTRSRNRFGGQFQRPRSSGFKVLIHRRRYGPRVGATRRQPLLVPGRLSRDRATSASSRVPYGARRSATSTGHCVARKLDVDLPNAVPELENASTPALPAALR